MTNDIKEYIQRCIKCQVSKSKQMKNPGLLQPLGILSMRFESVSIDFIVG